MNKTLNKFEIISFILCVISTVGIVFLYSWKLAALIFILNFSFQLQDQVNNFRNFKLKERDYL